MRNFVLIVLFTIFALNLSAQETAPLELAKATLKAHGGEKFTQINVLAMGGSGDVTQPGGVQVIPITFAIAYTTGKYRFDINGGTFFTFQQIYDGEKIYTSLDGILLPPVNLVGLPMLAKIEAKGFTVSALSDKLKKKKGFRVTSPDGFYTDFVIDEKTSLVKEYEAKYEVSGKKATTSVEIKKFRSVEGVMINEKFSQRLEVGQFSSYGNFNAKEIKINGTLTDEVFKIP